jgi:hypothetical protein
MAGAAHDAVFNTWRRFSKQILYIAPPMIFFYYAMDWATHRYGSSFDAVIAVVLTIFILGTTTSTPSRAVLSSLRKSKGEFGRIRTSRLQAAWS